MKTHAGRHSAAFYKRYVTEREPVWNEVETLIKRAEGDARRLSTEELLRLSERYPEVVADLALIRKELPSHRLAEHLTYLVGESYRLIYRPEDETRGGFFRWLGVQLPRAFRAIMPDLLSITFIFAVAALAGYFLTMDRMEFGRLFVNPQMEDGLRRGELWTRQIFSTVPASFISSAIIYNNISVTFAAFAGGILMGVGTLYIVLLNGVMLGSIIGMCQQYGMAGDLLAFVTGHGCIEISAILLSGAAGLGLARGILSPGRLTRTRSLQAAARNAAAILLFTCGVLLVAGMVEGFVSPQEALPPTFRIGLGILLEIGLITLIILTWSSAVPEEAAPQA